MIFAGILYLKKSYGRFKKKILYQCIPSYHFEDEPSNLLLPYQEKNNFSKQKEPLYILFRKGSPYGCITETLGVLSDKNAFYMYQIHSLSLKIDSLKNFSQITNFKWIEQEELDHNIITIDPKGCKDFDDGIGIKIISETRKIISICISNVPLFLEKTKLWGFLTNRISSIYLPNKIIPMLPFFLSENYCSLKEGKQRFVFMIDFTIENGKIINESFRQNIIIVKKNYIYEEEELLNSPIYKELYKITNELKKIEDSHDLISFWMTETNYRIAKKMRKGFFRKTEKDSSLFHEYRGIYVLEKEEDKSHEGLHFNIYTHITSPIRRIVDLINLSYFQEEQNIYDFSKESKEIWKRWLNKIHEINEDMIKIKRIQNRCYWVDYVSNHQLSGEGKVIEKNENEYLIYFQKEGLFKKYKSIQQELKMEENYFFTFYYFPMEGEWSKKIRIEYLSG